MAYEQESLCKLHTVYNYPGRFGTKGPFFYKLENYIADLCIVKPHHFWTRLREKELWLAAQFARWDVATNPVSNPLRFFDKHGNACFVPTDGPCYTGFEPGTTPQPGILLSRGTASQIGSKCYIRGNSTNGSNQGNIAQLAQFDPGNIDHLAQIDPALAQLNNNYKSALKRLLTPNTSDPTVSYVPIPWNVPPVSDASWTLKGDVKTRFDISSKESQCKLAIECRVAQLAIDKGIKFS